jgi:hypothetical protein
MQAFRICVGGRHPVAPENAACLEAVEQLGIIGTKVAEVECLMRQPASGHVMWLSVLAHATCF